MSKQLKLVIGVAAAVALLVCAFLYLTQPASDNGASLVFRNSKPTDINSVTIQNSYGTMNIKSQDQGYLTDDIPPVVLDMEKFVKLMTNCGSVTAKQLVEASPKDLSIYGLSAPSSTVDIKYNDNSSLVLHIGDKEKISGNYYFSAEGKPGVYLIDSVSGSLFLLPKKGFVSTQVTPQLQTTSPFSSIGDVTFTGGPLSKPVTLKAVTGKDADVSLKALSLGAPTHILELNGIYELDQTYGADLFNSLLGITANDVVGYLMTSQQISDFGFSKPDMQVEFDFKTSTDTVHYSLAVLKKDDKYYMTCNNNGVIYEVPAPQFLNIELDKLPVRWFLKPLIIDISKVELNVSGQTYDFALSGSTNDTKQVTLNGNTFNMDRFRTFYQLLTSAAGDGTLLDGSVKGEGDPLMTLTYYYLDSAKKPDTVKIYNGDTLRDYVEVNGVVEFAMRETFLTRVEDAVKILGTDQEIKTDW